MNKKYEDTKNLLCYTIYESNRLYNKFYQKALKAFELTYPQYVILLELWKKDHQTLKELTKKTDLKSNTLTPLLKRLEEREWLIREQPGTDKRQLILHLTTKAINEKENILKHINDCANIGTKITDSLDEYDSLVNQLHVVNERLRKIIQES